MTRFVFDTNTVSHILRRNPAALARLDETAADGHDFYMCPVVFYELWRGLTDRDARRQLEDLAAFTRTLRWVEYERPDVDGRGAVVGRRASASELSPGCTASWPRRRLRRDADRAPREPGGVLERLLDVFVLEVGVACENSSTAAPCAICATITETRATKLIIGIRETTAHAAELAR